MLPFDAQNQTGALEHEHQPLTELTLQSAAIGKWILRITGKPEESEYQYQNRGRNAMLTGKVFQVYFVSNNSNFYCMGKFKRRGSEKKSELLHVQLVLHHLEKDHLGPPQTSQNPPSPSRTWLLRQC